MKGPPRPRRDERSPVLPFIPLNSRSAVSPDFGEVRYHFSQLLPCSQKKQLGTRDFPSLHNNSFRAALPKKISDLLAKSEPKPGVPEDLQKLVMDQLSIKRSVIELEELKLPDSCFLPANDLSHSLSSYLKQICPKWAKLRKNHKEKKSLVMLIICSSALRALELIRSTSAFKGECKVLKLFAKHIKIQEQVKLLEKGVVHLGVGTPGRIKALIQQDVLNLNSLKYLVFDWNWRDQKLRRLMDIPEIRKEVLELLEMRLISLCRADSLKLGLF
ncbi:protein CMSS1 isoform X2 [Notamacropus eugenii]|uniref:protein CMSS1 isoform X2 n=1 Tax=Notamacropus eugenii TaxID=9315 RepID=UPI003B6826C3